MNFFCTQTFCGTLLICNTNYGTSSIYLQNTKVPKTNKNRKERIKKPKLTLRGEAHPFPPWASTPRPTPPPHHLQPPYRRDTHRAVGRGLVAVAAIQATSGGVKAP